MTYTLKLREDANVPPMTIVINSLAVAMDGAYAWKVHMQYDDSSRMRSATFETEPRTPICSIFARAFTALEDARVAENAQVPVRP